MKTKIQNISIALALLALPVLNLQFTTTSAQNVQPIYSFPQSPANPDAGLTLGPDGNFYGTTRNGTWQFIDTNTGYQQRYYRFSTP